MRTPKCTYQKEPNSTASVKHVKCECRKATGERGRTNRPRTSHKSTQVQRHRSDSTREDVDSTTSTKSANTGKKTWNQGNHEQRKEQDKGDTRAPRDKNTSGARELGATAAQTTRKKYQVAEGCETATPRASQDPTAE